MTDDQYPLSIAYLGARNDSTSPSRALEDDLEAKASSARADWPGVSVSSLELVAYVAPRAVDDAVRWSDLYIACACSRGEGAAIPALEARWFSDLYAALSKMRLSADQIDDVLQTIRRDMFTGNPGRIVEYSGRGDLRAWLRVSATRAALKLLRKGKREVIDEDVAVATAAAGDDPELAFVKQHYRAEFKAAFTEAIAALPAKDSLLLRQHLIDGLSIDELGALHGVHRATAARWLGRVREALLDDVRSRFMKRARVSREECESVLRLVRSRLDLSIRRQLGG